MSVRTVFAVVSTTCDFQGLQSNDVMTENKPQLKALEGSRNGIIQIKPSAPSIEDEKKGQHPLKFDKNREALLYVPKGYKRETAAPFALMLHGAGGNAQHGIAFLQHLSDEAGIILLAPKSQNVTWDVIMSDYGADVEFINSALRHVFERYNVDKTRLAVGGFSDGASYALSLGIINGELFTQVIAFSPGFMAPTRQSGNPRIYISHGTNDSVLPIEKCSRRLVPQLKRGGYDVFYREFEGPHTIPLDVASESVQWFVS